MNESRPTPSALDPGVQDIVRRTTVSYGDDEWIVDIDGTELRSPSQRGLSHMLAGHLYTSAHAGSPPPADAADFVPALQQDTAFESRLVDASAHLGRAERLAVVDDIGPAEGAVVLLQGVRVFVPGAIVTRRGRSQIDARLPTLSPRLSIGFLFYTCRVGGGSAGRPLRLYRHLAGPDEAVAVWRSFTAWAEEAGLPLRSKILSQSWAFPRNDALVVYLPAEAWHRLDEVAAALAAPDERPASSFARSVAPGVTAAWEPHDLTGGVGRVSFGEHRAAAVARGIVGASGDDARAERAVRAELLAVNVDPTAVYRNLDSPPLAW